MNKDEIIKQLQEENSLLKNELESTKNHLKKYTAPARNKKHYEANKELIKSREYKTNVSVASIQSKIIKPNVKKQT